MLLMYFLKLSERISLISSHRNPIHTTESKWLTDTHNNEILVVISNYWSIVYQGTVVRTICSLVFLSLKY